MVDNTASAQMAARTLLERIDKKTAAYAEAHQPWVAEVVSVDGVAGTVTVRLPGVVGAGLNTMAYVALPVQIGDMGVVLSIAGGGSIFLKVGKAAGLGASTLWAPWLVNRYYGPKYTLGSVDNIIAQTVTANRSYGVPFLCPRSATVDLVGFYVHTAIAGSNAIVGICDSNSNGFANELLVESSPVSTDTTGTKGVAIPATFLEEGKTYWLAIVCSAAIAITCFDPALSPFPDVGYAHNPRPAVYSDRGSFDLVPPVANFTDICPDIQLRRSA